MDIKQLKRFLDLCETCSFTQTAHNFFLSQQALSCSIGALEDELGKPLFQRTPRGLMLTYEGECLRRLCLPVVQQFDQMQVQLNSYFMGYGETLLMELAPGVLQACGADLIFRFRTTFPMYEVKATETTDVLCVENVLSGRSELAFCPKPENFAELGYVPIGSEPLYVVVNNKSTLANEPKLSLLDIKDERLVSLNKYFQIHRVISEFYGSRGITPNFIVETGEVGTLLGLVKLNKGLFVCMKHVADEADKSSCTAVPLSDANLAWEFGIVYKNARQLSRCASKFIKFISLNCKS